LPDAEFRGVRCFLLADIDRRIVPIGERPTLRDQPGIQVFGARAADGDRPAVSVGIRSVASDSLLAAAVRLAGGLARTFSPSADAFACGRAIAAAYLSAAGAWSREPSVMLVH
jgi:hypothetical protein